MMTIEEWLQTPTQNGRTYYDEVKKLFIDLEKTMVKKDLLKSNFLTYRNIYFSEFCRILYKASSVYNG